MSWELPIVLPFSNEAGTVREDDRAEKSNGAVYFPPIDR